MASHPQRHVGGRRGLRLADFELDPTGVRVPCGAGFPAGYLDGAEQRLLDGLGAVTDRSSGSDELRPLMTDWATTYHLTPYRSTILDALGLSRAGDARVLELGAGCGAVTRWLGERCGEVHAIEGDLARAHVARTRCADLPGIEVYAANYSVLDVRADFDLATLIGVLEYGHLYHPEHQGDPDGAALANLRLARRALTRDGVLVLAIENRLGLKYLNGAREDHTGRPFDGIEGYARPGTPVTWSARRLRELLSSAGFAETEFLVPFPDYKLAHTLINPARCDDADRVYNWLAEPAPDRGAPRNVLGFAETLGVREVERAGLLVDLANSFLVVAYAGDRMAAERRLGIDLRWTARRYSLERRAGLRKRATLRDGIVFNEHPADDRPRGDVREAAARFGVVHEPRPERFAEGELLLFAVLEAVRAEGIGPRFADLVGAWRKWLLAEFAVGEPAATLAPVSGEALDATWWNVVVDPRDGGWTAIDREWRLTRPVPADFVLWRMVGHFVLRHRPELPPELRERPVDELIGQMLRAAGVDLTAAVLQAFAALERDLVRAIAPGPLPEGSSAALAAVAALGVRPRAFSVLALADELVEEPDLIRAFARHFGPDDAATLMIYAPDADAGAAAELIEGSLRRAGVPDPGPDFLLLALPSGPGTVAAIRQEAAVVFSSRPAPKPFAGLPRYGPAEADRLKAAAEVFWTVSA